MKKLPSNVVEFPDAHAAIDGLLDAWLPRLIESNEILTDALLRVRDLVVPEQVRAEVEIALERAQERKTASSAATGSSNQALQQPFLFCISQIIVSRWGPQQPFRSR